MVKNCLVILGKLNVSIYNDKYYKIQLDNEFQEIQEELQS
jgi:hypothetical protein